MEFGLFVDKTFLEVYREYGDNFNMRVLVEVWLGASSIVRGSWCMYWAQIARAVVLI